MHLASWVQALAAHPELVPAWQKITDGCVFGTPVTPEARPVLLAAAYHQAPRPFLVVTPSYDRALAWQAKLALCGVPVDQVLQLPSGLSALFEDSSPEAHALSERMAALKFLVEERNGFVITTPQAVLERTLPQDILKQSFVELRPGAEIELKQFLQTLLRLGYEPAEPVRLPGQFARRGGILDIYATGSELPARIELFGDTVESLRIFDPITQRSKGSLEVLNLAPSREVLFPTPDDRSDFKEMLLRSAHVESQNLSAESSAHLEELVTQDSELLDSRVFFDRLDLYRPLLHPESGCALDLLDSQGMLVLDDPVELDGTAFKAEEELQLSLEHRHKRGEILHSTAHDFMLPPEHLGGSMNTLGLSVREDVPDWFPKGIPLEITATSMEPYRGQSTALASTLKAWQEKGFCLVLGTDQPNRAKSLLEQVGLFAENRESSMGDSPMQKSLSKAEPKSEQRANSKDPCMGGSPMQKSLLKAEPKSEQRANSEDPCMGGSPMQQEPLEHESESEPVASSEDPCMGESPMLLRRGIHLAQGNLAGGFILPEQKVVFLSDQELFGVGRLRLPQKRFLEGAPIATVLDLKPGDYVVHIHFGIGIYRGLAKREIDLGPETGNKKIVKEFLHLDYAAPDKLFVPADQLDRVQKYLNPGDDRPKLNRLKGTDWQKTVSKAREQAREFAKDLIKLYAQRKSAQRQPHGPDSPWQSEMEATFPWVETPSQLRAIQEVKTDLRQPYPMDRLVCGDVGFGKTEIAIRAAFKVVQENKQVAILCPTTILSEQHFRSFTERLSPWQVRIELLNRFRSTAERKQVLEKLERGDVDILIGTHALLNKELKFKSLGLVVLDEEQRFGVKQKEALKHLRKNVDVLTLSATPIPRTLSMALVDIRQMSLINDPPPGRLPVRTFVRPYSQEVVREALLRELSRGGQVYYVYNRVEGIYHIAERLRSLVPTAKIGVGHGQMPESELEPIMVGFIKGEIDILISTSIIENGLDISNANTLIVENADRFGMAQLYQLRGRVGRSDRQAYSYFLYQSSKNLSENANARLDALQEFAELGSGYSLAFRDLQIRGAGELLGARQHGVMASVGYELFSQIIEEEVHLLKALADGEGRPEETGGAKLEGIEALPTLDLPVAALIPEKYIKDQSQRLYYYKQMMTSRTSEVLAEVEAEILDRYGRIPPEVQNALSIMRLRLIMARFLIKKIDGNGGRLAVSFEERAEYSSRIFSMLSKRQRECYLSRDVLIWPFTGDSIVATDRLLSAFEACVQEVEAQRAALSGA